VSYRIVDGQTEERETVTLRLLISSAASSNKPLTARRGRRNNVDNIRIGAFSLRDSYKIFSTFCGETVHTTNPKEYMRIELGSPCDMAAT